MVAGDHSTRVLTRQHFTLSCVVPALDEERGIQAFLHALHQIAASLTPTVELVVINDGSRDRSLFRTVWFPNGTDGVLVLVLFDGRGGTHSRP